MAQLPGDVIRRLPRLDPVRHRFLHNVVFLVTPAFAKWLGADGPFLEAALQHMYENFIYYPNMRGIRSSVAVINRLPGQVGFCERAETGSSDGQAETIRGHEGIALWVDSIRTDSDILRPSSSDDVDQRLVKVTFMRPLASEGITAIELPPANTLFVNGNHATMFRDSWAVNPFVGPKLRRAVSREPLKTLELFVPSDAPTFSAPIEALTGRREILSSMGNVIRQLKSPKDGKPVPASAELEEKVPQYLARRREAGGSLFVFALVSSSVESSELNRLVEPSADNVVEADMSLIRRALLAGAHLHRVTSGGGGWGKKQGLLALDPAFDFAKHEDTGSLDAILEGEGTTDRANSMNAVRPGDFVQFFATYAQQQDIRSPDIPCARDIDTSDWEGMRWTQSAQLHTVVGSLPLQDDILMPLQDSTGTGSRIVGMPGHFGILSAGGTCLRRYKFERSATRPDHSSNEIEGGRGKVKQLAVSRVDIPYGFWKAQLRNHHSQTKPRHVLVTAPSEEQHDQ